MISYNDLLHSDRLMSCHECWILKGGNFTKMPSYWKFQPPYIREPHYFVFILNQYESRFIVYAEASRERIQVVGTFHSHGYAAERCRSER